ncbi:angiotensin-converting enzyme-like [Clytia hemisphaerica]|uniref:Angiotensin-converting enzyme n=1 Tax=Clytia hemisphaerica TaxID=252671 RepID=A0A7M5V393_9CNID
MERAFGVLLLVIGIFVYGSSCENATEFLADYNANVAQKGYNSSQASWVKATNITTHNSKLSNAASKAYSDMAKKYRTRAKAVNMTGATADERRQFKLLLMTMTSSNASVVDSILEIGSNMENIYSEGCIPYDATIMKSVDPKGKTCLSLDNYLNPTLAKSRDPKELLYIWEEWRKATGPKLKSLYKEYVRLNNIGAHENKFADAGDYKRKRYEVDDLKESAESFWNELKPFYLELHAFVRHRLAEYYEGEIEVDGPIPAHLLGNMWGQSWENVFDIVSPYKNEPKLDITPALQKDYDVDKMFKTAEEFFTSIGWQKLPKQFWTKSMLVKPEGRNVTCHASAWDFGVRNGPDNEPDVRVKMCTKIDQDDFITVHHELGHIYYDLLYWNQSNVYRDGANPGFHEAVGDVLALSVQTPTHLKKIGLLQNVSTTKEADINFLLKVAMERIAFLPFGYLMDQWMWNVYSGQIKYEDYNKAWWEMRLKYQGLKPPTNRSENDFDPGAKYHIPADTPYIRYFFAHILQFTFHKYACDAANVTVPLHQCSIYQSKEAGKLLGDMLTMGKSKPWPIALEKVTGSQKIDAVAIKEYFKPLSDWLKEQRKEHGYPIGWNGGQATTSKPATTPSHAGKIQGSFVAIGLSFLSVVLFMMNRK